MKPFKQRKLHSRSMMDKLAGREPPGNCLIELENHLATVESLSELPDDLLVGFSEKYKVDFYTTHLDGLKNLYSRMIHFFLSDEKIDQWEAEQVFRLQDLFCFPNELHNNLYEEVAVRVYKRTLKEVFSDNIVTESEKLRLEKLSKRLELPENLKDKITVDEAGAFLKGKMNDALSDGMLSPEEEAEIKNLADQIGINLRYDNQTKIQLLKARTMWQISQGTPPSIDPGISLRKNETCHFMAQADWFETRKVTKRVQYGGPQLRLKICKGVYWKMGDYGVNAVSEDVMKKIDTGRVFITNKRIIYMGTTKNSSINLNKILDFSPFADGVMIQKDTGKSPFLAFSQNQDMFCAVLARMISDSLC